MDQLLQQSAIMAVALLGFWIVLIGFSITIQRRDWAAQVAAWPFRMSFRLIRWTIGGCFVLLGNGIRSVGNSIRGGGGGRQDRRHR
jgi:hypothetical protein